MQAVDKERIALQVLRDMSDGLIVLDKESHIFMANHPTEVILEKLKPDILGRLFEEVFEDQNNDKFVQAIMNTPDDGKEVHKKIVPYLAGEKKKYLRVVKSNLHENGETIGLVVVITDITEVVEGRQNSQSIEIVESKNKQLQESIQYIRDTFNQYLSDEIVNDILDAPDGRKAGGTKHNITVMMSDLRGFTALCETLDGDKVMHMLNHYLREMGKIIKKHNGTIISYSGDGILSIFGEPIPSENHAVDAVVCALEMQKAMTYVNKWNREKGYPVLKMGIGINTGDAVIGNMGSKYAMKYNLIGSCVNLCGRIEGYTVAGQIFISPYTKEMIPHMLEIDDKFEVHPKGILKPLEISSVRGIKGPYNIHIEYDVEKLTPLKEPMKVKLYHMNGKKIPKQYSIAYITATSHRSREIITTEEPLEVHDDIMLRGRMDIYGKVMKRNGNVYTVEVTGRAKRN